MLGPLLCQATRLKQIEWLEIQKTMLNTPIGNRFHAVIHMFFLCFLMMCFLSISVILHEQQINCTSYSIVWHSCLFWIILISSTRLSTPWMCIVCFIQQVNDYDCLHMLEEKTIALLLYFVDKYKLYSDLKSTLKILFSQCGSLKSRSQKIFCFQLNYSILCYLLH